jgi:hypothetical protein
MLCQRGLRRRLLARAPQQSHYHAGEVVAWQANVDTIIETELRQKIPRKQANFCKSCKDFSLD